MTTPPPLQTKRARSRLWWQWAGRAVAGLGLLLVITVIWLAWDEREPDLSDILPRPRLDQQAQTNWADLVKIARELDVACRKWTPPKTLAESTQWRRRSGNEGYRLYYTDMDTVEVFFGDVRPREELEGLVALLEPLQEPLDAVLARERFESPLPRNFDETVSLSSFRMLAVLAHFRVRFGEREDAIKILRRLIRLADCIEAAEGGADSILSGIALRGAALKTWEGLVLKGELDKQAVAEWVALAESARPKPGPYAELLRVELVRSLHLLEEVRDGRHMRDGDAAPPGAKSFLRFLLRPNETRRLFADIARSGVRNLGLPPEQQDRAWERQLDSFPIGNRLHWEGNPYGRALVRIAALRPTVASRPYQSLQTRISAKQAWVAAMAYHRETGRLPDNLDVLTTDYLPSVPRDYLAGRPISYDMSNAAIWSPSSVGFNQSPLSHVPRRGTEARSDLVCWILPQEKQQRAPEDDALLEEADLRLRNLVLGRWKEEPSAPHLTMVDLHKDGTFSINIWESPERERKLATFEGTWSTESGYIAYKTTFCSDPNIDISRSPTIHHKIIETTEEAFTHEASDGMRRRLVRVHP